MLRQTTKNQHTMTTLGKPNALLGIVAIIALLWNLAGLSEFIKTVFFVEMYAETYTEVQMESIRNAPIWINALFGISTITGVLASIMLLVRKKVAIRLFAISVLAVIAQTLGGILALDTIDLFGMGQGLLFPLVVIVLDIFFYWFSTYSYKKGWIH